MSPPPASDNQSRGPAPRSGQRATFLLADGRTLEIRVSGAIAVSCSGFDGPSACVLRDRSGAPVSELPGFVALLSQQTSR